MAYCWVILRYLWRRNLSWVGVIALVNVGQALFLNLSALDPWVLYERSQPDYASFLYWMLCFLGYLTCLLVVWGPMPPKVVLNIRLRTRSRSSYALGRALLGVIVTLVYAACWVVTAVVAGGLHSQQTSLRGWILAGVFVVLCLDIHALIWLLLQVVTRAQWATMVFLALVYTGLRSSGPCVPMRYMFMSVAAKHWLTVTIGEAVAICLLMALILWQDGRRDVLL